MSRVGGQTPDSYGLSLSVVVPAASDNNSVVQDTPLVFDDTVAYGAAVAGAGEAPDMIAKHPVSDPNTPLGVWVFGYSRVNKVRFTGTAPALGGSVVSDGAGAYRATDTVGGESADNRVLFVDEGRNYVEVAFK